MNGKLESMCIGRIWPRHPGSIVPAQIRLSCILLLGPLSLIFFSLYSYLSVCVCVHVHEGKFKIYSTLLLVIVTILYTLSLSSFL